MKDSQIQIRAKSGRCIYLQFEDAFDVYANLKAVFEKDITPSDDYTPKVGDKVQCKSGVTLNGGLPWKVVNVDHHLLRVTVDPGVNGLNLRWVADFKKFNEIFVKAT